MPTAKTAKTAKSATNDAITVRPMTPARWRDLEALFGPRGAYGGCWCMFFRLPRGTWSAQCGEANKRAFGKIVKQGTEPGLLAYEGDLPIGWMALAPRAEYSALARSRLFKPIDDAPVWAITCFYVAKTHRRRGVTVTLLKAAAKHVAARGGSCLEGYPAAPGPDGWPDAYAYHGTIAAFSKAGFVEVGRPSKTRALMRRKVRPTAGGAAGAGAASTGKKKGKR